jgi:CRP/FNR family cyclic AMP-dependent transcriptional regulator
VIDALYSSTRLLPTQAIECIESGHVLMIHYDRVRELYFENPEFGFYFLRLVGERLLQNWKRAEEALEAARSQHESDQVLLAKPAT